MEKYKHVPLKEKINRGLLATVVFIACPGDDILALSQPIIHTQIPLQITAERTLELMFVHKRQEDEHEFFPWKNQKTPKPKAKRYKRIA